MEIREYSGTCSRMPLPPNVQTGLIYRKKGKGSEEGKEEEEKEEETKTKLPKVLGCSPIRSLGGTCAGR